MKDALPFDSYPGSGRALIGRPRGAVARREYGLDFMRKTGQTACAYCGVDLAESYERWLTLSLDHVVPRGVCVEHAIPDDWREDCSNQVLACAACNGFQNRYRPSVEVDRRPETLDAFHDLRDKVFVERKKLIAESHKAEREFFEDKPWLK